MSQINRPSSAIQVDNDNSSENCTQSTSTVSDDNNNCGNIQQTSTANVVLQITQQQPQSIRTSASNGIHRTIVSSSSSPTTIHRNQPQSRIQYLEIPAENFRITTTGSHLQSIGDSTTTTTTIGGSNIQQKFIKINPGYRIVKQHQLAVSSSTSSSSSMPTTVNLIPVSTITTSASAVHLNQPFELSSLISSASKQLSTSSSSTSETTIASSTPSSISVAISSAGSTTSSSSTLTGSISNNTTTRLISRLPIADEGIGVCKRCRHVALRDTFYGKGKQYCSPQCVRGIPQVISGNHHPHQPKTTLKIIKMLSTATTATTNSSSGIGIVDGSEQQPQQVVMLGTPISASSSGTQNLKGLTSIQIPTQQSSSDSNKSPIIAVTSTVNEQDTSSSTPSSNMKPRTLFIRQGTQLSQMNRSGHPTLINQHKYVTTQQQQNSIQIDPSNISIATNPSSTLIQHQQQGSSGIPTSTKSVKRNYSKIVTVSSSGQQTTQTTTTGGQIQLPSNGTLLAVQLNPNFTSSNSQSQTTQVLQVPHQPMAKRIKRNSGQQQHSQQQNGQQLQSINSTTKRSRSKSSSSTILSTSTATTQSFLSMDSSNSSIISQSTLDSSDSSPMIATTPTSTSLITAEQTQNKSTPSSLITTSISSTSSNSILINQLKKPVVLVHNGSCVSNNPSATTQSPALASTSTQSIQTNSSGQLFVQLASISSSGLSSNSSATSPIQIQSQLRTATTLPTTISNQQLQQFLQQNNLRIQHQQVAGLHPGSTTQFIPIRNATATAALAAVNQNNSSQPQQQHQQQPLGQSSDLSRGSANLIQLQTPSQIQVQNTQNNSSAASTVLQSNNLGNLASNNIPKQTSTLEIRTEPASTSTRPIPPVQLQPQQKQNSQQINNVIPILSRHSIASSTTNQQVPKSNSALTLPPAPPPESKPVSRLEQIKALDEAIESTMQSLPAHLFQRQSGIGNQNIIVTNYVHTTLNSTSQSNHLPTQHQSLHQQNTHYPPIWWLIFEKYGFDRCVPVWAFPNTPLNHEWAQMFGFSYPSCGGEQQPKDIYVELGLSDLDLNGNQPQSNGLISGLNQTPGTPPNKSKSNNNKTSTFDFATPQLNNNNNTTMDENKFWIAKIVGHSGYYLRLRFLGLEHLSTTKHDFWVNIRIRNLYPIGYAQQNNYEYRAPFDVCDLNSNYATDVRRFFSSTNNASIESDLYTCFLQRIETKLKPGLKVEAIDKTRLCCFRVATIQQVIGQRCFLRYDGEAPNDYNPGWWTHIHSEQIRPVGWSQLVGHKLFSSQDYATKSLRLGIRNICHNIESNQNLQDWNKLGVLKKFEYINEETMFREGMKLEAVNPMDLSQICVSTVRKVLRYNFLVLSIDEANHDAHSSLHRLQTSPVRSASPTVLFGTQSLASTSLELEDKMFCIHASSPYILPAGFCKMFNISLQTPTGYKRDFDWVEYCQHTNSLMAPTDLFSYKQFITDDLENDLHTICPSQSFEEGMLLEAVDMLEPNLICLAVIKRRCGRLLLLHFIGWADNFDQWCDCCSPNIFPVGYCDLVEYPLQGPPSQQNSTNGGGSKKKRQNNQAYNGNFNNRRRNSKKSLMTTSPLQSPLSKYSHRQPSLESIVNDNSIQSSSYDSVTKNVKDDCKVFVNEDFDESSLNRNANLISSSSNLSDFEDSVNEEETDIWTQIADRQRSELCNFLSWTEEITNGGRFDYHNKFTIPLLTDLSDSLGSHFRFKDPLLKQKLLRMKLENDRYSLDIQWNSTESHNQLYYNEDGDDSKRVQVFDSYHYFDPEDVYNGPDGTQDLRMLPHWSPKQVSKFLYRNGFADLCDSILVHRIDGKKLLSLSKFQSLQLALTSSVTNRLLAFIDCIRKRLMAIHHQYGSPNQHANSTSSTTAITASSSSYYR
ncbi:mbt repeat containing protein [Dermatophagoides farinae]|uniref:Mbt repeat containing protein n=1 Tax=Dermatophagoides farinae TaxID=6954 RepID=A0A9D4P1N2_DERFA|nr:serine-rich adhesin for platelets-like [Dermatophagoides farinae]KAH7642004.1 mbt repeat containing protein [Dermatophagoides farinae]